MFLNNELYDLTMARAAQSRRSSSYARDGSNVDFQRIPAGGSLEILSVEGAGIISHLWFALGHLDPNYLRGWSSELGGMARQSLALIVPWAISWVWAMPSQVNTNAWR